MNEQKIHSLIRKELTKQYESAKQKWLDSQRYTYFDIDWTPDWDYIRCEVCIKVERMEIDGVKVMDYLYEEYGDDYEVVMDGHVFQVWETMISEFVKDLEDTRSDLIYDKQTERVESKCAYPWRKVGF